MANITKKDFELNFPDGLTAPAIRMLHQGGFTTIGGKSLAAYNKAEGTTQGAINEFQSKEFMRNLSQPYTPSPFDVNFVSQNSPQFADNRGGILNQEIATPAGREFNWQDPGVALKPEFNYYNRTPAAPGSNPELEAQIPNMNRKSYKALSEEDQKYVRDYRMANPKEITLPSAGPQPKFDYNEGDLINWNKAPNGVQQLAGLYKDYQEAKSPSVSAFQPNIPNNPIISNNPGVRGVRGPNSIDSMYQAYMDAQRPGSTNAPAAAVRRQASPTLTDGGANSYLEQFRNTHTIRDRMAAAGVGPLNAPVAPPQSLWQRFRNAKPLETISDRRMFKGH